MKHATPNPAGREGKPISLAPYSFEDALQKILKATPVAQPERKAAKPKPRKKASKKRTTTKKRGTTIVKSRSNVKGN